MCPISVSIRILITLKRSFRKSCRSAYNDSLNRNFAQCDKLFKQKRIKYFWNTIRRSKITVNSDLNNISSSQLFSYFKENNSDRDENGFIKQERIAVEAKMEGINDTVYADFIFTEQKVKKYISMLKSGCAAGIDGIVPEHLKYASNSKIVLHLCWLLSVCFQFGVIPSSAMKGILVPLIKKPSLNPSDPKNYRPVILSNILSKIIEMYIFQEFSIQ